MMQFGYRPQLRMPPPYGTPGGMNQPPPAFGQPTNQPPGFGQPQMLPGDVGFDGKMLRKAMARKTIDYNTSAVRYLEDRVWKRDYRDTPALQADPLYTQCLSLPQDMIENPANCVTTKFIRAALNKDPRPIFCVHWTPDGRRLITGASSGEFTLWNGLTFNFETILQAHNSAVRSMIWSRSEQWMLTGDDKGYIKYWQTNMNNVKMFQGHIEAIRGLSFAPTDSKFTSCSDDRTVRIFDFTTCQEESVLNGHGSDVKCVDWHPFKALIVSGSKDSQQPIILWDPRTEKKITTLHAHKNTCTDLKWNQFNGNWLISSSRDHLCKLFDIRNLKEEVQSFRGHKKDACTVSWHPIYEKMFASGGADGSIFFWLCGADKELGSYENAHEGMVWDLSWHPLGHMLVSGSNDRSTRFWTRSRPGDTNVDKTDESSMSNRANEKVTGIIFKNIELTEPDVKNEGTISLPGLGLDDEVITALNDENGNESSKKSQSPPKANINIPSDYALPPPPIQLNPQQQQNFMLQMQMQQQKTDGVTPGLEDNDDNKRKAPYAKPIPKEFEKAWKSNMSVTGAPPPSILQMAGIMIDPVTKMPTMNMMQPPPGLSVPPPSMLQPPPGNMMQPNLNQPPPHLSDQISPNNQGSNYSPPDRSNQDDKQAYKRKHSSQDMQSEDVDDRGSWSSVNKQQFYNNKSNNDDNYGNNNNRNNYNRRGGINNRGGGSNRYNNQQDDKGGWNNNNNEQDGGNRGGGNFRNHRDNGNYGGNNNNNGSWKGSGDDQSNDNYNNGRNNNRRGAYGNQRRGGYNNHGNGNNNYE